MASYATAAFVAGSLSVFELNHPVEERRQLPRATPSPPMEPEGTRSRPRSAGRQEWQPGLLRGWETWHEQWVESVKNRTPKPKPRRYGKAARYKRAQEAKRRAALGLPPRTPHS